MENTVLQAQHISRHYGTFKAVDDISFNLNAGEIISFLGPNGAGKTTLLKIISNYLAPSSGSVEICGISLSKHPRQARQKLGVVFGGEHGFYERASARDNLAFFARLMGVKEKEIKIKVEKALKIVNLWDVAEKECGKFSRGMKQRLHIARGLVHDPEILLLDEPTASLDVESVHAIRELIVAIAKTGKSIILTSHMLEDIDTTADKIYLIGGGKIHYAGSPLGIREFAKVSASQSLEEAYLALADTLKRREN